MKRRFFRLLGAPEQYRVVVHPYWLKGHRKASFLLDAVAVTKCSEVAKTRWRIAEQNGKKKKRENVKSPVLVTVL